MLEQKLQEELNRYNSINRYGKTMIMEQAAPPPPPDAPPPPAGSDTATMDVAAGAPPSADLGVGQPSTLPEGDTQELDITDLVDMTKSIKKDLENHTQDNSAVIGKMDDVFSKLGDLETKLAEMDNLVQKIDQLGSRIEELKPSTPVEKLEMRSLDSYPFNEKPQEFFNHKMGDMQKSGKNEYILTKNEVENYPVDIKNTFNENGEEDEYKF
jgi:hypothetical protein